MDDRSMKQEDLQPKGLEEPKGWMAGTIEVTIDAPVSRVWDLLTGINRWPAWNQAIQEAQLGEPLRGGSTFWWKWGRHTLHSKVMGLATAAVCLDRGLAWRRDLRSVVAGAT